MYVCMYASYYHVFVVHMAAVCFVAHFSLWPSRHSMDNFMLHIWFFLNLLVTLIVANIVIIKLNVYYLFLCHSNCNRKICVDRSKPANGLMTCISVRRHTFQRDLIIFTTQLPYIIMHPETLCVPAGCCRK